MPSPQQMLLTTASRKNDILHVPKGIHMFHHHTRKAVFYAAASVIVCFGYVVELALEFAAAQHEQHPRRDNGGCALAPEERNFHGGEPRSPDARRRGWRKVRAPHRGAKRG
jgi:hypothetical protein